MQWEKWRKELDCLTELSISRCSKPNKSGQVTSAELHRFWMPALLDIVNALIIPRLQLTAAVVSVKVREVVRRQLEYNVTKELFWTDSQIILGYIGNDARRFHTYSTCTLPVVLNTEFEAKPRKNSGDITTQILILLMMDHVVLPPNNYSRTQDGSQDPNFYGIVKKIGTNKG